MNSADKGKDPSSLIGEKLLQGWTMLEEACDDCYIPLMRKPRSSEMLCVVCGPVSKNKETRKAQIISLSSEPQESLPIQSSKQQTDIYQSPHPSSTDEHSSSSTDTFPNALKIYLDNASRRLLTFREEDPAVEQLAKNMQQVLMVLDTAKRCN